MKNTTCLLAIFFILLSDCSLSQNLILKGYVSDIKTGEAIIEANITDSTSGIVTNTNKFGFFTLKLQRGVRHKILFSQAGYKTNSLEINGDKDTTINVSLDVEEYSLSEVSIVSEKKMEERAEIGKVAIPIVTIRALPAISGEADVMKAFQLMPGIQMGAENTNGLFVRGGSADQNLFLLDDLPLYNVNHFGGFFSVFDPSMLKSVNMYKGGFPARYGGRASSVMDIRTKDGNLYQHKGEFSLGLLSTKLFLEGPIRKEKSSYVISARYCNFGIYSLLYKLFEREKGINGYHFYDINLKTNVILSPNNRLFFNFYSGDDNIFYRETNIKVENTSINYSGKSDMLWGNTGGSIRWLHINENGFFNNITLSFTGYRLLNKIRNSTVDVNNDQNTDNYFRLHSAVNDIILKNDAEISLSKHTLRFGLTAVNHLFSPVSVKFFYTGLNSESSAMGKNKIDYAFDFCGYGEWEYAFSKQLSVNMGVRAGMYASKDIIYPLLEPRVVLNYLVFNLFSLKSSYTKMHQNMHLLTNSDGGLPTDIWIPSSETIKPMSVDQWSLGFAHTTAKDYELSVELYSKKMKNLIDYREGNSIYNIWQDGKNKIETGGEGNVKGLEFLIQKKTGKVTGSLAYTLSSNKRRFANINNGIEFPYSYDQTHNISFNINYKIFKNITLSAIWIYHSGNRITLPSAIYQILNYDSQGNICYETTEIYSSKNGYKLPDYHRLDIGFNHIKQLKKGIRQWSISIFNLYNRQNAYFVYYKKNKDGLVKLYQRSLFPIMINFSYSYMW